MTTTNMTPERLAEIDAILKDTCDGERVFHVRPDGTMYVSLGDRESGEHQQADFWFSKSEARFFTEGKSIVQDLLAEVHRLTAELVKVERERDALIQFLSFGDTVCPRDSIIMEDSGLAEWCPRRVDKSEAFWPECGGMPKNCWLQWAAQQADTPIND